MENEQEQNKQEAQETNSEQPAQDTRIQDLTATLQHLQADFENYRKRVERDQERMKSQAKKDIVMKLLSVLDHFDLALRNAPEGDFTSGIEMIYAQLRTTLEQEGVEEVKTEKLDPAQHEVLLQEESESEKGTIIEVLQKGYTLNGQLIRSAKVKIAK